MVLRMDSFAQYIPSLFKHGMDTSSSNTSIIITLAIIILTYTLIRISLCCSKRMGGTKTFTGFNSPRIDQFKFTRSKLRDVDSYGKHVWEERKIQAWHFLRQMKSLPGRAKQNILRAKAARKLIKEQRLDIGGDGITKIHTTIQAPRLKKNNRSFESLDKVQLKFDDREALFTLLETEIFKALDISLLQTLCTDVEHIELSPGASFISLGQVDDCTSFYIVSQGSVDLCIENDQIWHVIHEGHLIKGVLDIMKVLLGIQFPSCVEAKANPISGCTLLQITSQRVAALREKLQEDPSILVNMLKIAMMQLNKVTLTTAIKYLGLYQCVSVDSYDIKKSQYVHNYESTEEMLEDAKKIACQTFDIKEDQNIPLGLNNLSFVENLRESMSLGKSALEEDKEYGTVVFTLSKGESAVNPRCSPAIYIILAGQCKVVASNGGDFGVEDDAKVLYSLTRGNVIGGLSILTSTWDEWYGSRQNYNPICKIIALETCHLLRIPQLLYEDFIKKKPSIVIKFSQRILQKQSMLMRRLDAAMEWVHISAGEKLIEKGDICDSLYIILHGRLRVSVQEGDCEKVLGDLCRGNTIGEAEILSQDQYSFTVRACRESQLCKVPTALINQVAKKFPSAMVSFAQSISRSLSKRQVVGQRSFSNHNIPFTYKSPSSSSNASSTCKTVAILPISKSVPLQLFSKSLHESLTQICSVCLLNSETVADEFGIGENPFDGSDPIADIRGISWLNQQEESFSVLLYQCDWDASQWTQLCVRQADVILLVGNSKDKSCLSALEEQVIGNDINGRTELVLLHLNPTPTYLPSNSVEWIRQRKVLHHHHIRLLTNHEMDWDIMNNKSDVNRLARWLTDTSIGLVLGGGGARGCSHLGVIRALEEEGIPIDVIGGTSIGSFYGGLYAMHENSLNMRKIAKDFSFEMGGIWGYLKDFTFPFTSYFSGHGLNLNLFSVFSQSKIEDLWINFFCVTTSLTTSKQMIHQNGTMWRYIRASMSLCGYLPPLCDKGFAGNESQLHYLCDGGYTNNLPADVMKYLYGVNTIIAVDVGGTKPFTGEDYGDSLSGWSIFLRKLNPFYTNRYSKIPSLTDIQSQLAYVSSVRQLEKAKKNCIDLYLIPPVDEYKVFDFRKFSELDTVGYEYALPLIRQWKEELIQSQDLRAKLFKWSRRSNLSRSQSFHLKSD